LFLLLILAPSLSRSSLVKNVFGGSEAELLEILGTKI